MMRITPFRDQRTRFLAGKLGLRVFLISLGILFGASLVGFLVIRLQLGARNLWPANLPPLPKALWLSTIVLIISGVTMQRGLNAIRTGRDLAVATNSLVMTTLLGWTFLVIQAACWLTWLEPVSSHWHDSNQFRYALTSFYILTGLHALHVIG